MARRPGARSRKPDSGTTTGPAPEDAGSGVRAATRLGARLGPLAAMYFVQGLPFGFQTGGLVYYLGERGASLASIGFSGALASPWLLKALWAPLVEGTGRGPLGRRRSWILPLQVGLAVAACALAVVVDPDAAPDGAGAAREVWCVVALVLAMNLLAATMDVAVDGLAVDTLQAHELGLGNTVQVVGFKLGMIAGGGALALVSAKVGWRTAFLAMALVVTALAPLTLAAREPEVPAAASVARSSPLAVLRALPSALRVPGAAAALAFVGLYKTGESVLDGMFKPFLLRHFDKAQVALWVSTYGTAASVLGSVCGGLLVRALGLYPALATAALLRLLPDVGIWWLTWAGVSEERVVAVTLTEHFFGGLLTPAVFALMMAQVDRRIGGTHFTLLSVVEVLGKTPGGWLSGVAVTALGFEGAFGLGAALSAAVLLLLLPLRRLPAVRGAR